MLCMSTMVCMQVCMHVGTSECKGVHKCARVCVMQTNCSALGNTGTSDGGALSITGGAAVISNSSFVSNTAQYYGGAIAYIDECFSVAGKLCYVQLWPHLDM